MKVLAIHNTPAVTRSQARADPPGSTPILQSRRGGRGVYTFQCHFYLIRVRQRGRRCKRNARRAFVRSKRATSGEEKREERTGWRIKQRGSCKSRVEARDTSLALSRLRSATAAIEIDLTLPYGRHRRPYHRNYGPDPRCGYVWNSSKRSTPGLPCSLTRVLILGFVS